MTDEKSTGMFDKLAAAHKTMRHKHEVRGRPDLVRYSGERTGFMQNVLCRWAVNYHQALTVLARECQKSGAVAEDRTMQKSFSRLLLPMADASMERYRTMFISI